MNKRVRRSRKPDYPLDHKHLYKCGRLTLWKRARKGAADLTYMEFAVKKSDLEEWLVNEWCASTSITREEIKEIIGGFPDRKRVRFPVGIPWPPEPGSQPNVYDDVGEAWRRAMTATDNWLDDLVAEDEESEEAQPEGPVAPTIGSLWSEFAEYKLKSGDWSIRTLYGNEKSWKKWIEPKFHTTRSNEVTPEMLEDWRRHMQNTLRRSTVKRTWDILSNLFDWLKKMDNSDTFAGREPYRLFKNTSPFANPIVSPTRGPQDERPTFTWKQVQSLIQKTLEIYPDMHTFMSVAVETGMRIGEIRGLRWSDITLSTKKKRGFIQVQRSLTYCGPSVGYIESKGKTENAIRKIPLSPTLNDALSTWFHTGANPEDVKAKCSVATYYRKGQKYVNLRQRKRRDGAVEICTVTEPSISVSGTSNEDDWVFASALDGGPIPSASLSSRLKRCKKAAGLPEAGAWHELRHSFISHAMKKQVDFKWLQSVVGHAKLETTLRYTHLIDPDHSQIDNIYGKDETE